MPTASPHSTRGPSRSTQELQNPSNELAYRGIWTERLARGFPPLQGKTSDSICTKNSGHSLAWSGSPDNELCRPWGLLCWPQRAGKLPEPHLLLSTVCSPRHLGSLTRELGSLGSPSFSPARAGNQASHPIQLFSVSSTYPYSISALNQQLLPQTDPDSKPHCPRTLLADGSRNPDWDNWWRTFSTSMSL